MVKVIPPRGRGTASDNERKKISDTYSMKDANLWLRCLPIALLAIFGTTALIVCNPGYFWDDWVWIFHERAENIQIGKELGIWWGGYATTFINGLSSPSIAMRATALVAWAAAATAIAAILRRRLKMSGPETFQYFLIYCATHVAMIRFLTSAALYNVYIAVFWIGTALLLVARRSVLLRWAALICLFFSFYLNSLIVLYAVVVALLILEHLCRDVTLSSAYKAVRMNEWHTLPNLRMTAMGFAARFGQPLREFARSNIALLALPFIFIVIKRLTTVKSELYGNYNDIHVNLAFSAIGESFATIRPVVRDFFATASQSVASLALVISALICFALLRLVPREPTPTSWRAIRTQITLGLVFFAAAVYPYIIVDKAPDLRSFYDARNILPAIGGLDLILIGLINVLDRGFAHVPFLRRFGKDLLIGYVLGASISSATVTGINLWRDWFRQTAIINYLQEHRSELREDKTFVFNDTSTGTKIGERMIWNYEYTGNLIKAFGGRDHFGISLNEYAQWPPNVSIIADKVLRKRFNIRDYDFRQPHVIITIKNGPMRFVPLRVIALAYGYLRNDDWRSQLSNYFVFELSHEFTEADQRVKEMFDIGEALAAYHRDHGHYPVAANIAVTDLPTISIKPDGSAGPHPIVGDIPGLFPTYMPRPDAMQSRFGGPNYQYFSDGVDFKLVYTGAMDLPYAAQTHPALYDARNSGYGVWTWDARNW